MQLATDALFTQYLDVVNRALGKHRDQMPYQQLIGAAEKMLADERIGVSIYKRDPGTPYEFFTIGFSSGTFEILEHGKQDPDLEWKVKEAHLTEVTENPQPYLESPMKLDIDWLKTRLGL